MQAFESLKKALVSAPALGLPNVSKPFLSPMRSRGLLWEYYRYGPRSCAEQLPTFPSNWMQLQRVGLDAYELRAVAAVILNIQEA